MKIYTKTGDKGETSLFDGSRVLKTNTRIKAYGTIDEVNSYIGFLISQCVKNSNLSDICSILKKIQDQLFILGSDLANPSVNIKNYPRINDDDILYLEDIIDKYDSELEQIRSFILPGGSQESSISHIIRTIVRRAEIFIAELFLKKDVDHKCLVYVNRLSDFFFIISRIFNKRQDIKDIIWKH